MHFCSMYKTNLFVPNTTASECFSVFKKQLITSFICVQYYRCFMVAGYATQHTPQGLHQLRKDSVSFGDLFSKDGKLHNKIQCEF